MTCEAHVDNLQVVIRVQQNVSALEIAMCKTLNMHVNDTLQELPRVEPHNFWPEFARVRNVIKKFSTGDKLLNNVGDRDLGPITLKHRGSLPEFNILHDALMVQLICRLDLLLEQQELLIVEPLVVQAEHLHCEGATIRVHPFVHFGGGAFAKFLFESVLIDSLRLELL